MSTWIASTVKKAESTASKAAANLKIVEENKKTARALMAAELKTSILNGVIIVANTNFTVNEKINTWFMETIFPVIRPVPAVIAYGTNYALMKYINMELRSELNNTIDGGLPPTLPDKTLLVNDNWKEVKEQRSNGVKAWNVYPEKEAVLHQPKDGTEVKKIGAPDGREGVYNADTGELITDPTIYGTFNYSNPDGFWGYVGHAIIDVMTWALFGEQG